MNKSVHRGKRHGWVRKDAVPFSEGLVGGDHDGTPLISCGDEFEEHAGLGLVLGDVGQIIEDEQIELVELCDGGFELESRRATCIFWTRSVVRVNSTRQPFSISARPMAAARWLFPPPGGPNMRILAPLASQLSPAAMAITWALETMGTASNAKLSSVFPGGRCASAR